MKEKMTQIGGLSLEWIGHSTVGIYGKNVIYIDPFAEVLKGDEKKADVIISTHGHRDHFDVPAINRLARKDTYVVIKSGCEKNNLAAERIKELQVGEKTRLLVQDQDVEVRAVAAYNTKRFRSPGVPFHPEGFGMGVEVGIGGMKLYYAGDTDFVPEMKKLRDENIDIAFLPIGGKYTMDLDEALEAVLAVEPKVVIPVHYNYIKGTEADPNRFKEKVEEGGKTKVVIL